MGKRQLDDHQQDDHIEDLGWNCFGLRPSEIQSVSGSRSMAA